MTPRLGSQFSDPMTMKRAEAVGLWRDRRPRLHTGSNHRSPLCYVFTRLPPASFPPRRSLSWFHLEVPPDISSVQTHRDTFRFHGVSTCGNE